jgi:hypothetical protein
MTTLSRDEIIALVGIEAIDALETTCVAEPSGNYDEENDLLFIARLDLGDYKSIYAHYWQSRKDIEGCDSLDMLTWVPAYYKYFD